MRYIWTVAVIAVIVAGMLGVGRAGESLTSAGVHAAENVYKVDPAHSSIIFQIRHFGIANFYGMVTAPMGTVLLDDPDAAVLEIEIQTKYVNGGNDSRNRFLASPDFFNVREYPKASFKAESIRRIDESTFEADGIFTMRGVSRPLTVRLTGYAERTIEKFGHRCAFETTFTINRSEFGMDSHLEDESLGDEVTITVSIEAARPAE